MNSQRGQSLTEYAVLVSLIAIATIAVTSFFAGAIKGKIASMSAAISGADTNTIKDADERSKSSATKAANAAKGVGGMSIDTEGDDAEVLNDGTNN